jgi:hypothetical protein
MPPEGNNAYPLFHAIDTNDLDALKAMDPRVLGIQYGSTPSLHFAAACGNVDAMETLLEHRPDLLWFLVNENHNTAMHWAASYGQNAAIEYLHQKDPALARSVNAHGETPAHRAAYSNKANAVRLLFQLMPEEDFCRKDNETATLAHAAASNGYLDTVIALHEVSPLMFNETNQDGHTPQAMANFSGHAGVVNYLGEPYTALMHHGIAHRDGDIDRLLRQGYNAHDVAFSTNAGGDPVGHTLWSVSQEWGTPAQSLATKQCIENALPPWSTEAHLLFFNYEHRRGVVYVLMMEYILRRQNAPGGNLPKEVWLRILKKLPRIGWRCTEDARNQEAQGRVERNRRARALFLQNPRGPDLV